MDSKVVSSTIARFSLKFINELEKKKSVICSPLSAESLLALLTLATTDPSHSELLTSLGLKDDDSIRSLYSTLTSRLKTLQGVKLNIANKVYIKDGDYDLHPQLKVDAVEVFDAEMEKVDFTDASTVQQMNEWVENKTNNKIKDLMKPGDLNGLTRLILINAIYFKGAWKDPFHPRKTYDHTFYVDANTTVEVPMMFQEHEYQFGFSEALQAQLLDIPYLGDEASMLIVLPKEVDGLTNVMEKLAAGYDLLAEAEQLNKTKVRITIPKFKVETSIDLKRLLPKLGISAIFNASNSGITKLLNTEEQFVVSGAIQKAFIEVNEEGSEAAAATKMKITKRRPPTLPEFRADHPYLYLLLGLDRVPLFIGVYCGSASQ